MAEFEYEESHVLFAWPAFVDLLAASLLLLLVLIAVVIVDVREGTLTTWRQSLIAQLDTARQVDTTAFAIDAPKDSLNVRLVLQADATFPRNQFRFDSLRTEAKTALDRIGSILVKKSIDENIATIRVVGHTDTVPYSQASGAFSNWELSAVRAGAVARYLTENSSIDPCKVAAVGRGESYPIRDTGTNSLDPTKSRRIEVYIVPKIKPSSGNPAEQDRSRQRQDHASPTDIQCWNPLKVAHSIGGGV